MKPGTRKRPFNYKRNVEQAILKCEWNLCVVTMQNMRKFLFHVAEHVAAVTDEPTNDGHFCLWRNCGFASHNREEFDRHIYFHAFHAKLKGVGELFLKQYSLQCTMDDQSQNMIPEFPDPLECMWDGCGFLFTSPQDFYWHVQGHVITVEKTGEAKTFPCSWEGCTNTFLSSNHLLDHVRSHTQEKVVGCPNCGTIFAGLNKFQDHCYRHLPEELQTFECSHCKCKFATERLLKEHVRRHINHFKCPHCEMTCTTKTTMETHIKYRHTNNKPLKCPECHKRFKLQYDVMKHLTTHSADASYVCLFPGCEYKCRAYNSYTNHLKKVHEGAPQNPYICHMCDKRFPKGFKLTIHLKEVHNYHWPAGHTRFRYSKDEHGYYKLQTTRFESMELAHEILKEAGEDPDDPNSVIHEEESLQTSE